MNDTSENDESEFYYPEESSDAKILKPNNFYWKRWESPLSYYYIKHIFRPSHSVNKHITSFMA